MGIKFRTEYLRLTRKLDNLDFTARRGDKKTTVRY